MNELTAFTEIVNVIGGKELPAAKGGTLDKLNPHDGSLLFTVSRSDAQDVSRAIGVARDAQPAWAEVPAVKRGDILRRIAAALLDHRDEVARIVALETGKSLANALGEVEGAASLGFFYAGEGQRLYGKTTTSGTPNKWALTVRQPVGVAGLIIAANTPIANVAWKVFPALICGNAAVLKAAEDTPATALVFARIARAASGYIYYVSLKGITGAGHLDVESVARKLPLIKAQSSVPVGVGFGIRDAATARAVAQVADAVVIGSRIIQALEVTPRDEAVASVERLMTEIRRALDADAVAQSPRKEVA